MSNTAKHTGTVKFFNVTKGYGFIKSDIDGEEYFVHATGLNGEPRDVKEGARVSFVLEQGKKGMNAVEVSLN